MKPSASTLLIGVLFACLFVVESYSQCLNRGIGRGGRSSFSIELGAGLPMPFSPSNNLKLGDAQKVELGIRYVPEESNFGLRGYYAYANFSDSGAPPSNHGNNLKIQRLDLQGIFMLQEVLRIPRSSNFELESYIGLGAALGRASGSSNTNKMIAATIGLRPRMLIDNHRLYVYLDTSYGMLINQKYDYSGEIFPGTTDSKLGATLHLSLGLSYRL